MFRKILIANRGEIAVRVERACREMGVRSVAVFSDVDRAALHVRLADEAHAIGAAPSRESYLVIEKILDVARRAGCDAVHPGYGFLAENPAFARACAAAGVTFIGPSAEAMEKLGSKTAARHIAKQEGVPTVPGTLDPIERLEEALRTARESGYPVVLKAVAGGGGKGMRLIAGEAEFAGAWRDAESEARNAFGDGRLYLEKFIERPRHVEIQVLGDTQGNMVYLGERECSVQRRYQKVIEEAPSAIMTPELRRAMGSAAVKLARAGEYTNAGTVEFLVDAERNFYFLEMNTRLQVEHPVTEMVTSLDLVKLQMRIAAGEQIPFGQEDVATRGHAIECRIYAEDPENNFLPSPGKVLDRRTPAGPGIRLDDGVYIGWTVPNEYDPLLGKLIAWGEDRSEAIARMRRALGEYYTSGIKTNVMLFQRILASRDFQAGDIYTRWLDDFLRAPAAGSATASPSANSSSPVPANGARTEEAALIAAAMWYAAQANGKGPANGSANDAGVAGSSKWKDEGRREQVERTPQR
ncbi:MAG TPA: acetyl-CoA carboxylase biotin carboxylase subunit [Candidatus Acidoferrales bacterium]|nr:acetyl-CoA carboxylase biotin carboxylase subunit [Candidatus Acidoferrales bacterium]